MSITEESTSVGPVSAHVHASVRLVRHIVDAKLLFFPVLESIMTDPNDGEKPGAFLELFPHPLSKLYLTLLWKVNREQDGDAVVLSNVWLREFAKLDEKSLRKYRAYLHEQKIILSSPAGNGNGRQHLYRVANPRTGKALNTKVTNKGAIAYLSDVEAKEEIVKRRVAMRWARKATPEAKSATDPEDSRQSSWDDHGW